MILDQYERTYSAPPDEIGSTTGDIDFEDDYDEPPLDWSDFDYLIDNNPSDTETL